MSLQRLQHEATILCYYDSILRHCLIPLASERPHSPVPAIDVCRIKIIDFPSQTSEDVLPRLHQQIVFTFDSLFDPLPVPLHVPLRIAGADDGDLCLQQHGQSLLPLVRAGRMAQAGMEEDEGVEIGVVRRKISRLVDCVEVVHDGAYFQLGDVRLDDGAEGVLRCALWKGEFAIAIGHGFWANEDEVERG